MCVCAFSISVSRGRSSKPIFVQIAKQVVALNPTELRLPSRAWKVKLVGEGADDAGGVFDDTITEMCQVSLRASGTSAFLQSNQRICSLYIFPSLSLFAGAAVWCSGPAHPHPQQLH